MDLIKRAHSPLTKKHGPETSWNSIFHLSDLVSLSVCFMYYTTSPRKGLQQYPRSKCAWKGDSGVSPEALEALEVLVLPGSSSSSSKSTSFPAPPPPAPRPAPSRPHPAHTTLTPNCSSLLEEIQFAGTVVADVHKESSLFQESSLTTVYPHIGFHHLPAPHPPHPGGFTVMEP